MCIIHIYIYTLLHKYNYNCIHIYICIYIYVSSLLFAPLRGSVAFHGMPWDTPPSSIRLEELAMSWTQGLALDAYVGGLGFRVCMSTPYFPFILKLGPPHIPQI